MSTVLPFGKHQGQPLEQVPSSYLRWCLQECDLDPPLRSAIRAELQKREAERQYGRSAHGNTAGRAGSTASLIGLRNILKTWFAGLARDYHPDRKGGDGRPMAAINDAHERLRKLVGI